MTWTQPVILAFVAIDLVLAVLLLEAWRRTKSKGPCPPPSTAEAPFLEQQPDENGPSTEALILDLGRAMDSPEDRGPFSPARPERLQRR